MQGVFIYPSLLHIVILSYCNRYAIYCVRYTAPPRHISSQCMPDTAPDIPGYPLVSDTGGKASAGFSVVLPLLLL